MQCVTEGVHYLLESAGGRCVSMSMSMFACVAVPTPQLFMGVPYQEVAGGLPGAENAECTRLKRPERQHLRKQYLVCHSAIPRGAFVVW
jgi:hypothetical protein